MPPDHGSKDVGSLGLPIPVPTTEKPEEFEHLALTHYFHATRMDAPQTVLDAGRTLHRIHILERPRSSRDVYFDITLRELTPSSPADLRLQASMIDLLGKRTCGLPDTGCVLCHSILESQRDGRLTKDGDFELLAQVRHLAVERIAAFRIACSLCRQVLLADQDFESDDLSACRRCQVVQRITHEMRKVRHPKTGNINPGALIMAINSSIELRPT